jgi:hypothetical protein
VILELPFSNDPAQSFLSQLGDKKYGFNVKFNDRSGVWTLDLSDDATKAVLLQSVPLVLGCDLLEPYNFGIGRIMVMDTTNRGKDATAADLGDRVKVYWFSSDEVLP